MHTKLNSTKSFHSQNDALIAFDFTPIFKHHDRRINLKLNITFIVRFKHKYGHVKEILEFEAIKNMMLI